MGFKLITIGLLFLFNPMPAIYDILPDFIGFIFIFCGLRKLAFAFPEVERCRKSFFALIWIGVVKFVASVVVFYFAAPNSADDDATILTITFIFFIVELIFIVPAMRGLIDKIAYVGLRCDAKSPFRKNKRLKNYTTVFFVLRAFAPVVPEFYTLSNYEVNEWLDYMRTVYRSVLTMFNVLLVLILGIIWLCMALSYFIRISKDTTFISACKEKFEKEFSADRFVFIKRTLTVGLLVIMVAFIFNIDFYAALNDKSEYYEDSEVVTSMITDWGMVNLIPDILCAVLLCIALIALHKYNKYKLPLAVTSAAYLGATVFSYSKELLFNSKFVMDDLGYYREAELLYNDVIMSNGIKCIAFILVLLFITLNIISMVREHTGQVVMHFENLNESRSHILHTRIRNRLWVAFAFGVLAAVISLFCVANMPYVRLFWLLDMVVTCVHICMTFSVLGITRKEIIARYEK